MDKRVKAALLITLLCYGFVWQFHENMTFVSASEGYSTLDSSWLGSLVPNQLTGHPYMLIEDNNSMAQSINVTETVWVTQLAFKLKKGGAPGLPTGNSKARIWAATGTHGIDAKPSGSPLATTDTLDVSTLTTGFIMYYFNFTKAIRLDPGIYCVGYNNPSTGTIDANNYVVIASSGYETHEGNLAYNEGFWFADGGDDLNFAVIGYTTDPYEYMLTDTYYENGTIYGSNVDVLASSDTYYDTINGEDTYWYLPEPTLFTWNIGSSLVRKIYSVGDENLTITMPDGSCNAYSWDIRDYAGKIGDQDSYLEALRTINGTQTLIERNLIYNSESTTALNLVTGKTYFIRIRLNDGTYYNFGYYTPDGVAAPPTINLYGISFDDQYQPRARWITTTITRPNATHIQIHYNETLHGYSTFNVTVYYQLRNGTIIGTNNSVGENLAFNWYNAVNTTDYLVIVEIEHGYYGVFNVSKLLAGDHDYDDVPDWSAIGLPTDLVAVFLILVTIGTVSRVFNHLGLFAGCVVAYGFVEMGWVTIPVWLISLVGMISVGLALRGGR